MPVSEPSYDNIARVIGQMRVDDREFITPETVSQFAGCTEGEAAVAIEAERRLRALETAKWKLIEVRSQAGTALDAIAKAEHDLNAS